MEVEYSHEADAHAPEPANSRPPRHHHTQGCNRRPRSALLPFGRTPLQNGRSELSITQEVFSVAYKMLMKHKGLEKQLLDIPFNLCLLLAEKRPAFLIQVGDHTLGSQLAMTL